MHPFRLCDGVATLHKSNLRSSRGRSWLRGLDRRYSHAFSFGCSVYVQDRRRRSECALAFHWQKINLDAFFLAF
ncbi:hypothetical protein F2P81_005525 [Scophthalmus maximus]|uniref:Uncharacterized protein n=1 Tax=Scophthalmus maximus TaxID=52904 RepID=A0A6A4T7H3_SCOMX|nr:hypothetical protein F2P81_005525 [Scophthalmus maximus]